MSSPPKFWQGLARAIEQPDLFDDTRFADRAARIAHQEDADRADVADLQDQAARIVVRRAGGAGRAVCAGL